MHRSVIASFFAVGALGEEIPGMDNIGTKCRQVVSDLGQQGLSDQEIAAFCRAAYSPDMCRAMRSELGSQPWSQERATSACQGWQDLVLPKLMTMPEERQAMTVSDIQDTLDQTSQAKSLVGVDLPRDAEGRVDMEGSVMLKLGLAKKLKGAWLEFNGVNITTNETSELEESLTGKYKQYQQVKKMHEAMTELKNSQRLYGERSSVASTHSIASAAAGVGLVSMMAMAAVMTTRYLRRTPDVEAETSFLEEPTSE